MINHNSFSADAMEMKLRVDQGTRSVTAFRQNSQKLTPQQFIHKFSAAKMALILNYITFSMKFNELRSRRSALDNPPGPHKLISNMMNALLTPYVRQVHSQHTEPLTFCLDLIVLIAEKFWPKMKFNLATILRVAYVEDKASCVM